MTTLPFTLWMGSTTTATALLFSASKLCSSSCSVSVAGLSHRAGSSPGPECHKPSACSVRLRAQSEAVERGLRRLGPSSHSACIMQQHQALLSEWVLCGTAAGVASATALFRSMGQLFMDFSWCCTLHPTCPTLACKAGRATEAILKLRLAASPIHV